MTPAADIQPDELIKHVATRLRAKAVIATEAARLAAIAAAQEQEAHDFVASFFDAETADFALGYARRTTDVSKATPADVTAVPGLAARLLPSWGSPDAIVLHPPVPRSGGPRPDPVPAPTVTVPTPEAPARYTPEASPSQVVTQTPVGASPPPVASPEPSDVTDAVVPAPVPGPVPLAPEEVMAAAPVREVTSVPASTPPVDVRPEAPMVPVAPVASVRTALPEAVRGCARPDVPPTDRGGYAIVTPAGHHAIDPTRFTMDDMRMLRPKGTPVRPRVQLPQVPGGKKDFFFVGVKIPATKRADLNEIVNDALFIAQSERLDLCTLYDNNLGKAVWRRQVFRTVIEMDGRCVLPKPESRNKTARNGRDGSSHGGGDDETTTRWTTSPSPVGFAVEAPDDESDEPSADVVAEDVTSTGTFSLTVAPAPTEATAVASVTHAVLEDDPVVEEFDEDDWHDPDDSRQDERTEAEADDPSDDDEGSLDDIEDAEDSEDEVGADDVVRAIPVTEPRATTAEVRQPTLFSQLGRARDERYGENAKLREPTIVSGAPPEVAEAFERLLEADDVGAALDAMLAASEPEVVGHVPTVAPEPAVPIPPVLAAEPSLDVGDAASEPHVPDAPPPTVAADPPSPRRAILRRPSSLPSFELPLGDLGPVHDLPDFMVEEKPTVPKDDWDEPIATVRPYVRKTDEGVPTQVRIMPPPFEVGPLDKGIRYAPNFHRAMEMARNNVPFAPPPPMTS